MNDVQKPEPLPVEDDEIEGTDEVEEPEDDGTQPDDLPEDEPVE